MTPAQLLQLVQTLSAVVDLANSAGINSQKLLAMKSEAAAEGRDLGDTDLLSLSTSAQASIDAAKNA